VKPSKKNDLQEETEQTEDEEMMQNPSFSRKVNELRPDFRRNPLNLYSLCSLTNNHVGFLYPTQDLTQKGSS
jgi:hypothetical protein